MKCCFSQLCVVLGTLAAFSSVSSARAEYYSWVDDDGVLHLTNIKSKQRKASPAAQEKSEHFGGVAPIVVTVDGGKERKLYRVNVSRYDSIIRRASEHYRLPFAFVKSVVKVESNFNPKAVSKAGAKGLMQLMDFTAKDMLVENSFDPEQNIFGGTRYLRLMANQFNGDIEKTAAAYNAGPTAVKRAGGIPNYRETKKYVARVKQMYEYYRKVDGNQ
ncbi:MAG: lytic transglycosylase domain-containing protein [Myxococcota bacterium]|nr:lytic transglycosylase domain-containing protein [Myxococcota bacterium]